MTKTIIITGAGSGIGKATAQLFIESGWNVGLIGRRENLLKEVGGGSKTVLVLPCDVTDPKAVKFAFAQIVQKFGHLDTLFNNAGIFTPSAPIDETPLSDWYRAVEVNLTGSFLCAREAFRQMRLQVPQGGRIINNGSVSAHSPRKNAVPYTATKHPITGLTKSISVDGRPYNIACGQIDVGNAQTKMLVDRATAAATAGEQPEDIMDVADVAKSVLHMAQLPLQSNVLFMTVMATNMPYLGRG